MRLLPGAQRVVEHHPGAAERPGQRLLLPRRGVETVVVPQLHPSSMTEDTDTRAEQTPVSSSCMLTGFVTNYRHQVLTART
jgi:hypothetical protein